MRRLLKQLRFGIRLMRAFVGQHLWHIFLGAFFGSFAIFALLKITSPLAYLPTTPKEIKIGMVGRPQEASLPDEITQLTSLGLTKLLPNGVATSSLAKSWDIDREGKVFRFYLRDNLLWPDGEKFTAKDVGYQLKNAQLKLISDFQIEITLKEPFSPLPALVSQPIFKKSYLGLGDYQIVGIKKTGRYLEKLELLPNEEDGMSKLLFRFYPTEETARIAFKLGEVDELKNIVVLGDLEDWPKVEIVPRIHEERYGAIFLNLKKGKFENKSFRQALAYALKKEEGKKRAFGPVSPNSWVYNQKLKPYSFDLAHAKELLDKPEQEETIQLLTFASLIAQAEKIKQDWEELGIKTEIKIINQLPENPEDFEALLAVWEMPVDPDQYSLWHSTQATNLTGITNPKIDKLLEEGRKTFDEDERREIYQEFQKTLVEECPAIFLFHPETYTISR